MTKKSSDRKFANRISRQNLQISMKVSNEFKLNQKLKNLN